MNLKSLVIRVVDRFDALDREISVNDEPACTKCRELCHAVDDLWAAFAPDHLRYDEFGTRRRP